MNYSLSQKPKKPGKPEAGKVWVATPQVAHTVNKDEFIDYVANCNPYLRSSLSASIDLIAHCLRQQLRMGNKVDLGDLGSFFVTFKNKPFEGDKATNYDSRCITDIKPKWSPGKALKSVKGYRDSDDTVSIDLRMVPSLKDVAKLRKAIKTAETEVRLREDEQDGSDGSGQRQ
ncbi:MAG: hypothetical protein MJY59_05595 [Bacteroidaceae bacterium]|nr:hypothetical protein [Bacteroidaceae bacterium]